MSLALTDFLIAVSDPAELLAFREAPDKYMSKADLTDADKEAVLSEDSNRIRSQAKTADDLLNKGLTNRFPHNPALIEIDPMIEVTVHTPPQIDQTAIGRGMLFINERGQWFKATKIL